MTDWQHTILIAQIQRSTSVLVGMLTAILLVLIGLALKLMAM